MHFEVGEVVALYLLCEAIYAVSFCCYKIFNRGRPTRVAEKYPFLGNEDEVCHIPLLSFLYIKSALPYSF